MVQRNTRLVADTAEVLERIGEVITGLAAARGRCQALTVTARAEHGSISVVADGSGTVAEIVFAEDIEDLGYARIARGTVQAAQAAGAEVKRRADAIMAPLRDNLARLPKPAEMLGAPPAPGDIPAPPPALLTPPSERETPPDEGVTPSADIVRLQKARTLLMATGTAERRRVTVTVNADGIIVDIQFSSGITDLDHEEIAEAIVEASRQAVAEVARRGTTLFAPVSYDRSQFPGIAATLAGLDNLRDQLR